MNILQYRTVCNQCHMRHINKRFNSWREVRPSGYGNNPSTDLLKLFNAQKGRDLDQASSQLAISVHSGLARLCVCVGWGRGHMYSILTIPLTLNCPVTNVYQKHAWTKEELIQMMGQVSGPASILDIKTMINILLKVGIVMTGFFPHTSVKLQSRVMEGVIQGFILLSKQTLCPWYRYHNVCQNRNK